MLQQETTYISPAPLPRRVKVVIRRTRLRQSAFIRHSHGLCSVKISPFAKNLDNLISGLKERVFYINAQGETPPGFVNRHAKRLMSEWSSSLGKIVREGEARGVKRLGLRQYVRTRPSSTIRLYEKALANIQRGLSNPDEWSVTKLFTKFEKTVHDGTKQQVPRIINPRAPEFNILLGSYLHPVEKKIFTAMQQMLGCPVPVVAKGLTLQKRAECIVQNMNDGYIAIGLDASRFDQSIRDDLLEVEHACYNTIYRSRELASLLRLQMDNVGRVSTKEYAVKCRYGAIRCSGDVNTSLGNCIISYLMCRYLCTVLGIADYRMFLDGDDLLLFVKPNHRNLVVRRYRRIYLGLGIRMKLDCIAAEPEQVCFCQSRPVETAVGWTLCREPVKCLNTDYCGFAQCKNLNYFRKLLRNVGLCGMAYARGMPILQEFYLYGIRCGKTGRVAEMRHSGMAINRILSERAGEYKSTAVEVTPQARASFHAAFGIAPRMQVFVENYFKQLVCNARVPKSTDFDCELIFSELLSNGQEAH